MQPRPVAHPPIAHWQVQRQPWSQSSGGRRTRADLVPSRGWAPDQPDLIWISAKVQHLRPRHHRQPVSAAQSRKPPTSSSPARPTPWPEPKSGRPETESRRSAHQGRGPEPAADQIKIETRSRILDPPPGLTGRRPEPPVTDQQLTSRAGTSVRAKVWAAEAREPLEGRAETSPRQSSFDRVLAKV